MTILDWFDLDNIEHLRAYRYLEDKGYWPGGFLPEDITFVACYHITLAQRMADRFVSEKLLEAGY